MRRFAMLCLIVATLYAGAASSAEPRTLVVGSEQDYPPFATGMTDQQAGGFTVDLWKAVAAEAGLDYTIKVLPFNQILKEFKAGNIDVSINLAISDERQHFADFSVPHVIVNGAIFVRRGESSIRTEADLAGKAIIVLNADLAHDYAIAQGWEKQLVLVDNAAEGMRLLAGGEHDALLLGKLTGLQTLQKLNLSTIEALKVKVGFAQKFAFAVREGNSELLSKLNEGLALSKSDGTYNRLYEQWFGIYEERESGQRNLILVVALSLGLAGYLLYRRKKERKDADARLRTLYTAVEQSPASVVVTDLEACIQYVNPSFTEATGYSASEVIGKNPRFLQSGLTNSDVYPELWSKLCSGQTWHGELHNRRKNGELYWEEAHIAPVKSPEGTITHYVAMKTDISLRKQAEARLAESEARLRAIIETEPECIKIVDAEGCLMQMNPAGLAIIEAESMSQVVGCRLSEIIAPAYREAFNNMHKRVIEGEAMRLEFEVIGLKGTRHFLETHAVPMQDQGRPVHLAVTRDISRRKEYELELKRSNAELEQFSYAISHDMRQPLRMISSYLQLLELSLKEQLDHEKRDYFNFAIEGAKRIDQMLVALLEYSRVGRLGEPPVWTDSRAMLDEALQFLQPTIAEANARLHISGDWPHLQASHDEIVRLMQNLIGNAVKYRIAGRQPEIEIASSKACGEWHLSVADNGVGIIPSQIKRLFQVFQRLHSRDAYEGTGIGLALCRKIAEHHKGRIWAESSGVNLGSKFSVVLPVPMKQPL